MLLLPLREMFEAGEAAGLDAADIAESLSDEAVLAILKQVDAEREAERFGKFSNVFPDTLTMVGNSVYHPRAAYRKHLEFFRVGATYRERCFMAGNRVGKTFAGSYEMACHLTGLYPKWWAGKRFRHAIRAWACGKTNETTRDIVQRELIGEVSYQGARKVVDGSGMIPRTKLDYGQGGFTWKQGVPDLIDTIRVRHVSGSWSKLGLKSYQQGRGAFEGTAQHVIWDDEEPPLDVWGEQIVRLATTKGIMMLTFTPLEGISDVVQQFLPAEMRPQTA